MALANVVIELAETGYVVTGLEVGKYLAAKASCLPLLFSMSVAGELYPFKIHGTEIHYHEENDCYAILIGEWLPTDEPYPE